MVNSIPPSDSHSVSHSRHSLPPDLGRDASVADKPRDRLSLPVVPKASDQDFNAVALNVGRCEVWDPRKSHALKKGLIGSITRLSMKLLGRGDELKAMKAQAKYLNEAQTRGRVRNYHRTATEDIGSQRYLSRNNKVLAPKIQDGQLDRMRFDYGERKAVSKKMLAAQHVAVTASEPEFAEVADIPSLDGHTVWHPVRTEMDEAGDVQLTEGQVLTTSERVEGSTDLNNSYIRINDDGSINITTGAVDNEKRAEELMVVMGKAIQMWEERNAERPDDQKWQRPKLRLSMHQLNAFGLAGIGEESMIRRQHKMVAYIETHLRDRLEDQGIEAEWIPKGPVIGQLNQTMNGFTSIPGESEKCHKVNAYGLAVQTRWMQDDIEQANWLKNISKAEPAYQDYSNAQAKVDTTMEDLRVMRTELSEIERVHVTDDEVALTIENLNKWNDKIDACLKEIRELPVDAGEEKVRLGQLESAQKAAIERLSELQPLTDEIKARKKQLNKQIAANEKQLRKDLKDLGKAMTQLSSVADYEPEAQVRLQLMGKLLAAQTGEDNSLSGAQQLQLMFLIDELNGAVTQSNCKSGLDRNGFARALKSALRDEIEELKAGGKTHTEAVGEAADRVMNFESRVNQMDREWRNFSKANPGARFHAWVADTDFVDVANFQTKVFAALMGEGRPITHFSTGTSGGFKWHHTKKGMNPLESNPHPVPYMPVEVSSGDEAVQLMSIGRGGKRKFTEDGGLILEGQSQSRGG